MEQQSLQMVYHFKIKIKTKKCFLFHIYKGFVCPESINKNVKSIVQYQIGGIVYEKKIVAQLSVKIICGQFPVLIKFPGMGRI